MEKRPMFELIKDAIYTTNMDESNEYSMTHSDYGSLLLDPSTGYLLRMVNYRPSKDGYMLEGGRPEIGYVIFSSAGDILGETTISTSKYLYELFFISEQGLHIARTPEREGEIIFDIFSIEPR